MVGVLLTRAGLRLYKTPFAIGQDFIVIDRRMKLGEGWEAEDRCHVVVFCHVTKATRREGERISIATDEGGRAQPD